MIGYGVFTLTKPPFEYDFFELDTSLQAPLTPGGNESLRALENREYMVIYEFADLKELAAEVEKTASKLIREKKAA